MDVEWLGLVNEGSTVGGLLDDILLRDLPDSLVKLLDFVRDRGDVLDASVSGDDVILEVIRLDAELCEVAEEVLVDHLELPAEHPLGVEVTRVRLHTLALVVAENLGGAGGGHGRHQEAVPHPVLGNFGLERGPVVEVGGGHTPHVLEDPLDADSHGSVTRLLLRASITG